MFCSSLPPACRQRLAFWGHRCRDSQTPSRYSPSFIKHQKMAWAEANSLLGGGVGGMVETGGEMQDTPSLTPHPHLAFAVLLPGTARMERQCTKAGRREKIDKGPIPTRLTWEGWSREEAAEGPGACSAPTPVPVSSSHYAVRQRSTSFC